MSIFTPAELDMLTDEEREGLLEGEEDDDTDKGGGDFDNGDDDDNDDNADDDNADTAAGAGDGADAAGAGDGADGTGVSDADATAAAAAAAAAEADSAQAPGRDDGADVPKFRVDDKPVIRNSGIADAEARLEALEGERIALAEAFDAGEKDTVTFMADLAKIESRTREIEMAQFQNRLSEETAADQADQRWFGNCERFMNANPELSTSDLRLQAFDYAVRKVTGDEANKGKTDEQMLQLARENWAKELGIELKKPGAAAAAATEEEGGKGKPGHVRAPKQPIKAPPTLGGVPAAAAEDTSNGRFASLDRLMDKDPIAFEEALSRMSETDREAYLEAN